ncbi:MAG: peptidase C1 [Cytophagia bacterium]|nr:MAG: peptidase C1 [Cytophagia bacterium]TAG39242.1 MAG: peptidase C1 [Cytophagia bacterium]
MKHEFVGYKFMKAAPKTKIFEASSRIKSKKLPNKVDLRPYMSNVEDQGQVGSCTANAVAGACEYLIKKNAPQRFFDVSRLFVYYNARWRGGTQDKDSGCFIQYAVESLQKFGVCSEKKWKYDTAKVLTKPNEGAYEEAANFKISDYQKLPLELEEWKKCLADGYPIIFGCALFKTFDECQNKGGIVAMPSPEDTTRGAHGAHAMLCVGYSDIDQLFIVRNSWGANWGDNGHCYMPYNYLMNPKFNFNDCWMIRSTGNIPNNKESWDNEQTTIINDGEGFDWFDADEVNNQYDEADYDDFDILSILEEYIDDDAEYNDEEPEDYEESFWEGEDLLGLDDEEEEFEEDDENFASMNDDESDEEEEEEFEEEDESEEEGEEEEFEEEDESEEEGEEEEEFEEEDESDEEEGEEEFEEEDEFEEEEGEEEESEEDEEFEEEESEEEEESDESEDK